MKTPLLPASGINIDGQLKTVELMEWKPVLMRQAARFNADSSQRVNINLRIQKLLLNKVLQGKATLSVNVKKPALHITLNTDKLKVKLKKNQKNWDIQLSNLNIDLLNPSDNKEAIALSPQQFSTLKLICHNCQLKSQQLNKLSFNIIKRQKNKATIESLQIFSPYYQLIAQGDWQINTAGQQVTKLVINSAKIPNLGNFLTSFDGNMTLKGGDTTVTGHLSWLDHPFNINPYKISANLALKISQGEFSNVKLGMAKLLSVFNRSKLQQRLRLDFSDISKESLLFDRITGDIQVEKGVASTKNILIETAVMLAGIKGHSNFLNYSHNQLVTVIPDAKSSLPVIGLLLGGVGVGVALALIDKVTDKYEKKLLNHDHVGMRYRIRGSWQKPKISALNSTSTSTSTSTQEEF